MRITTPGVGVMGAKRTARGVSVMVAEGVIVGDTVHVGVGTEEAIAVANGGIAIVGAVVGNCARVGIGASDSQPTNASSKMQGIIKRNQFVEFMW